MLPGLGRPRCSAPSCTQAHRAAQSEQPTVEDPALLAPLLPGHMLKPPDSDDSQPGLVAGTGQLALQPTAWFTKPQEETGCGP